MIETSWIVVKNSIAIISVLAAGLAAVFTFWGSFADKNHTVKIQNWFLIKAQILKNTPLRLLPQNIVKKIFRGRKALIGFSHAIVYNAYISAILVFVLFLIIFLIDGSPVSAEPFSLINSILPVWFYISITAGSFFLDRVSERLKTNNFYLKTFFVAYDMLSNIIVSLIAISFLSYFIQPISNNLHWLEKAYSILGAAIMPLIVLGFSSEKLNSTAGKTIVSEEIEIQLGALGFSAGLSIMLTTVAIWIGTIANPKELILPNIRIISVNMFFDSLTIAVILFSYKFLKMFSATIFSFIAAVIFGGSSLYFSLLGSEGQLSLYEVVRVLGGLSPKENDFSLGVMFWIAHSTIIPFVLYITILSFSVLMKFVIVVTEIYARTASGQDVAVIRMIGATFGIIAFIFGSTWKLIS